MQYICSTIYFFIMRNTILLLFLFQGFLLSAQEPPKMLKYDAEDSANIFYYQLDEVQKKIKIKKEKVKNVTRKALISYNNKIKDISFLNFQKLRELETLINSVGDQVRGNPDLGRKLRKNIEIVILPIRDSIEIHEKKLNTTLETVLSKKQYKRWIKYQRKQKRNLLPERPRSTNQNVPSNMNRRSSRGRSNRRF